MTENIAARLKIVLDVERGKKPCKIIDMPWFDSNGDRHVPLTDESEGYVISNLVANFLVNSLTDAELIEHQIRSIAEFNGLNADELVAEYKRQLEQRE